MPDSSQKLPSAGPAREALRQKGQFWTPDWVAEAMVAYAVRGGSDHVFDPAVGAGAFFRAAKTIAKETGCCGREHVGHIWMIPFESSFHRLTSSGPR